jgi:hypothetical protein
LHSERTDNAKFNAISPKTSHMSARDSCHFAVKSALIKAGWIITADPYRIIYQDIDLYADLAAEKPISAERAGRKIVVEIKSFTGRSSITDLHGAVGQYIIYRQFIQLTDPSYELYLAIDDEIYENFFSRESITILLNAQQIKLLVVDLSKEEIQQWIEPTPSNTIDN